MKKIIKFSLATGILIAVFILFSIYNSNEIVIVKKLSLGGGESHFFDYKIRLFGLFDLGGAKVNYLSVKDKAHSGMLVIKGEGYTSRLISLFFNPQVSAESMINLLQVFPEKFIYSMAIPGLKPEEKVIIYDHKNMTMELDGVRRVIFSNTQDPLSAMYYIQNQKMAIGKEFDININTNQKNYRFQLEVKGKKELIIKNQKVTLWLLEGEIARRDKSRRHKTYIKLWFWEEGKAAVLVKVSTSGVQFIINLSNIK